MKASKGFAAVIALIATGFGVAAFAQLECGQCELKAVGLNKLLEFQKQNIELLQKNQEVLSTVKSGIGDSRSIKLRSNISLIQVNLASVEENILNTKLEFKNGCSHCKGDLHATK